MVQFSPWGLGAAPEAAQRWVPARSVGLRPWEVPELGACALVLPSSLLVLMGK